jgi:hypothetical protein
MLICSVILCLSSINVFAKDVLALYQAEISVSDTSKKSRNQAIQQALQQVLIKVSGDSMITTHDAISKAMSNADNYVERFRYKRTNADVVLQVSFLSASIDQLLSKENLTSWGTHRPLTIVWLVMQTASGKELVGTATHDNLAEVIQQRSKQRGLPTIIPMLDLQDIANITAADVWYQDEAKLILASNRYDAQAIIIGRIGLSAEGSWQVTWSGMFDGEQYEWKASGKDIPQLLTAGVDYVVDSIASEFKATTTDEKNEVLLTVLNVNDYQIFSKVQDYLQNLTVVESVTTENLADNQVTFSITLRAGESALQRALRLGNVLIPATFYNGIDHDNNALLYRWIN